MRQARFLVHSLILVIFISLSACAEENPQPDNPNTGDNGNNEEPKTPKEIIAEYLTIDLDNLDNYSDPNLPAHYRTNPVQGNDNTPGYNPVSNMGATLGRVLFYDKQLSLNNTIACASCHTQESGFTDPSRFSEGFEGELTGAHSMRLGNTNYFTGASMFWDKRAESLESQSTMPIQDGIEMGFTEVLGGMDSLINKLAGRPYYPILFERAFGSETITEERIQYALSQFVRSMVSVNSKFDEGYAAVFMNGNNNNTGLLDDFPNFTEEENLGKRLYFGNGAGGPRMGGGATCNTCHQAPTFALSNNSRSNGLDAGETTIFKSPSLKNIAIVGGYMHDGRFATLREVIDHYADGILVGPALDQRLRTPGPNGQGIRINLSPAEREAMVAFLETLTDEVLISDQKFSDPFVED